MPFFDVYRETPEPSDYDFLISLTPVLYDRLCIAGWLKKHIAEIEMKPVILVTVSGAPPDEKPNAWLGHSSPADVIARMKHIALRGRQPPSALSWFDRLILRLVSMRNPDSVSREEERKGFDYMDRSSIAPIEEMAHAFRAKRRLDDRKKAMG